MVSNIKPEVDIAKANAKIAILEAALVTIADWDLPKSGVFYQNNDGTKSDREAPYDSILANGQQGGKDFIRKTALVALEAARNS